MARFKRFTSKGGERIQRGKEMGRGKGRGGKEGK